MVKNNSNNLYPVFLQLNHLKVLVVGGGFVGEEKINSLLKAAPDAVIKLVALEIKDEIKVFAKSHPGIQLLQKSFEASDIDGCHIVIAATNNKTLNEQIKLAATQAGVLANIADTPELCDFYLGSIVNKGDLKIAISTNGKSPTIAKRVKEVLNETFPSEMEDVLNNMQEIRNKLNGNFAEKVKKLNEVTAILKNDDRFYKKETEYKWRKIASKFIIAFALMVIGHMVFSYLPIPNFTSVWQFAKTELTASFLFFIIAGFVAQMVDGILGMGYGVTSATCLMSFGVSPVSVSAAIHTSEIFTTGVSGFSHYKFGNVNKKLFKHLLIPGVIGAILGALLLVYLGEKAGKWLLPIIATYAMFLGVKILLKAFQQQQKNTKIKNVGILAWAGGFLDSFGGGGWGPIVTSTLISKGRSPRYTIGTVNLTEFFITLSSAFTFLVTAGIGHWSVVLGLLIGGSIAAPFAAKLTGKLPRKPMMIGVGIMVIIWSVRMIIKSL